MTSQTFKQKLSAVRDFTAAALFAGGAIFYYHSATPPDPRPAEAKHAFVDANPIRLDWVTAAFKPAANTQPQAKAPAPKPSFVDENPIRLGR
ncbi:MAG: hypothetical protein Q8K65_06785 [Alphaproteobacteria bacterium]|nr:hypothetical protein [Alphaproteobacteria bacterium]